MKVMIEEMEFGEWICEKILKVVSHRHFIFKEATPNLKFVKFGVTLIIIIKGLELALTSIIGTYGAHS